MKKLSVFLSLVTFGIFMFLTSMIVGAQVTDTATAMATVPVDQAFGQIWHLYLANKGSTIGLIFVGVQALMLLINTPLSNFIKFKGWTPKLKILVVSILTFFGVVISAWIQGGGWQAILTDVTVLTTLQVTIHSVLKFKKK